MEDKRKTKFLVKDYMQQACYFFHFLDERVLIHQDEECVCLIYKASPDLIEKIKYMVENKENLCNRKKLL